VKLPAYKAGHQKGNSNLFWGNTSPKPPGRAIHPRAQHGVFWQHYINKTGFEGRKIWDIIFRLRKQGKIKSDRKGLYVKA